MESNITKCRICLQLKPRILDGKFNTKDKRWLDEHGKLWNGLKCPECHKSKVKSSYKKKEVNA